MGYYFERCIVLGTGQFAFHCAKHLRDNYWLDGVYEYGNYGQSGLGRLCKKSCISYIGLPGKAQCRELMDEIESDGRRTLIVSASNTYLFPQSITQSGHVKAINYHPALLEKHLGRNAEAWAIYGRDRTTGVTWHEVTSEVDHGAVVAEKEIELDESITSVQLMIKQYQVGFRLFRDFIGSVLENKCGQRKTVSDYGKMHYSYEKPNDGILDLGWSGEQISAFLRSMDYSALNIMGRPYIVDDNERYCWDSYKILDSLNAQEMVPDDRIIVKNKTYFVLKNYHRADS